MSTPFNVDASPVGGLCQRNVVTIGAQESIVTAAERMRSAHVGCLVVTEAQAGTEAQRAIGMLTDRDIVVSVVARNADPNALTVGDVMTRHPLMVAENASLDAALGLMQDAGVRRVIITGSENSVAGILTIDDILLKIGAQLGRVCGSIRTEMQTERLVRP
jgi:CBS domain-containing protein